MILADLSTIGDALRRDGWRNTLSGLGVLGRDRAVSTAFYTSDELDDQTLSDLYHYSDLPALIVDIFPEESLRRGLCVGLSEEAQARWTEKLLVRATIQEAARWGRLFGLSLVVIGAEDGRPANTPLDLSVPRPVSFLEVYDRRAITPVLPASGLYSRAEVFTVQRHNGARFDVHRSRCLVFGGAPTGQQERERRQGADLSVLQRPYEILRDYANGFLSLGSMLTDASQGVLTIKGLVAGLAGKMRDALISRLQLMDASRSIAKAILLDADGAEKFEKISTSFAGVPESIDRLTGRLSVATGIPVERLGQALAGLNATGESSTRAWYDRIESYREHEIKPRLSYLARVELGPSQRVTISFPALWQPTEKEIAEVAKIKIDAGVALADREAVTGEELSQLAAGVGIKIDSTLRASAPIVAATGGGPGVELTPSDIATITLVREARASVGFAPFGNPDDDLTVAQYKAKYAATIAAVSAAEAGDAPPPAPIPVEGTDDEDAPQMPAYGAALAAEMTEAGAARCEHGKNNRCRLCGVEKDRGVIGLDEQGGVIGRMAWRSIS